MRLITIITIDDIEYDDNGKRVLDDGSNGIGGMDIEVSKVDEDYAECLPGGRWAEIQDETPTIPLVAWDILQARNCTEYIVNGWRGYTRSQPNGYYSSGWEVVDAYDRESTAHLEGFTAEELQEILNLILTRG